MLALPVHLAIHPCHVSWNRTQTCSRRRTRLSFWPSASSCSTRIFIIRQSRQGPSRACTCMDIEGILCSVPRSKGPVDHPRDPKRRSRYGHMIGSVRYFPCVERPILSGEKCLEFPKMSDVELSAGKAAGSYYRLAIWSLGGVLAQYPSWSRMASRVRSQCWVTGLVVGDDLAKGFWLVASS